MPYAVKLKVIIFFNKKIIGSCLVPFDVTLLLHIIIVNSTPKLIKSSQLNSG